MRQAIAAIAAIAPVGCAFSPLAHRIKVGEEPFVVFVGEGRDQHTDLFAVPANGGPVTQVTFTALIEMHPRLTPTGEVVAFIRMRDTMPDQHRDVVVINLVSYGEIVMSLPDSAGSAQAVAWSDDASKLYVRTTRGVWQATAPPAQPAIAPVATGDAPVADSALDLWLGKPRFARVVPCSGGGLCIIGPKQDTTSLAPEGREAIRWGADSVAWFQGPGIMVRSLGPGHERLVTWKEGPSNPRDATYARGVVPASP